MRAGAARPEAASPGSNADDADSAAPAAGRGSVPLMQLLRDALTDHAKAARTTTYRELADRIGLKPPRSIGRLTSALERLMEEDAAAARPLLASLCAGKAQAGLPGPGFFIKANEIGVFSGEPESLEASDFYANERRRALLFYGGSPDSP
jgi:hypothetical protein